jgi:hypothetical protein
MLWHCWMQWNRQAARTCLQRRPQWWLRCWRKLNLHRQRLEPTCQGRWASWRTVAARAESALHKCVLVTRSVQPDSASCIARLWSLASCARLTHTSGLAAVPARCGAQRGRHAGSGTVDLTSGLAWVPCQLSALRAECDLPLDRPAPASLLKSSLLVRLVLGHTGADGRRGWEKRVGVGARHRR